MAALLNFHSDFNGDLNEFDTVACTALHTVQPPDARIGRVISQLEAPARAIFVPIHCLTVRNIASAEFQRGAAGG